MRECETTETGAWEDPPREGNTPSLVISPPLLFSYSLSGFNSLMRYLDFCGAFVCWFVFYFAFGVNNPWKMRKQGKGSERGRE